MSNPDFFEQTLRLELKRMADLSAEIFAATADQIGEVEMSALIDRAMSEMERQFKGLRKAAGLINKFHAMNYAVDDLAALVRQFEHESKKLLASIELLRQPAKRQPGDIQ